MGEIIAVTGTDNGVGCTTMAVLLGGGTGERRRDVGLLDATVQGSRVADVLDVESDDRLVAVARGDVPLRELQQDGPHGLSVYAGADTIGWADISSSAVSNLYELLRDRHERTFVDCGALGTPASSLWLAHADRLVIVTDSVDEHERSQLRSTADAFGLSVAGTILNKAEQPAAVLAAAEPTQLLAVTPVDEAAPDSAAALQTPFWYDPDSPIADLGWRLAGRFDSEQIGTAVELPEESVSLDGIRERTQNIDTADDQPGDDNPADDGADTTATALPTGNPSQSTPTSDPTPLGEPEPTNHGPDDDPTAAADDGAASDAQSGADTRQPNASDDSTAVALPAEDEPTAANTTDRAPAGSDESPSNGAANESELDQHESGFKWDSDVESPKQQQRGGDISGADGSVDEATASSASEPTLDEGDQSTAGLREHVESMVEVALQRNREIRTATTASEIDTELSELSDAELHALLQDLGVPSTIPSSMTISEETFDPHGVPLAVTDDWGMSDPVDTPETAENDGSGDNVPAAADKQSDASGHDAPESSDKTLQSVVEDLVGDILDAAEDKQAGDDAVTSVDLPTEDGDDS